MIIAFYILDDRPSLWSQVFTSEAVIGAAFTSALITGTWFAAIMYMKRDGKRFKTPASFKYFVIATIALMVFAFPATYTRYGH